jgi:hypothetical protein
LDQSLDSSIDFVSSAVSEGVDVAAGAVKYGLGTAAKGVDTAGGVFKGIFTSVMTLLQAIGLVSIIVMIFLYWMWSTGHLDEYIQSFYSVLPIPKKRKGKGAAAIGCGSCM